MTNVITGKFETASGDYPRALELQFITSTAKPDGSYGYEIKPDDAEARELWLRFFRIHGQEDRADFMGQRHQRGLGYAVPCRDPEHFEKWLKANNAIVPKAKKERRYKNLPPMAGTAEEDREEIEKALRLALATPSLSRRISIKRAIELGIEIPRHIVEHWAFAIADDRFDMIDLMPSYYADIERVYPGVIDGAIDEAKRKRGIPVLTNARRNELYKIMKGVAGRMGGNFDAKS